VLTELAIELNSERGLAGPFFIFNFLFYFALRQLREGRQVTTAITTTATTSSQQRFPFHVGLSATGSPREVIEEQASRKFFGRRWGPFYVAL
jgi:hypothetical protein